MTRNLLVALIANGAALAANPVRDAAPLFFIANQGQAPPAVRFMAKGSGLTAYFAPHEALFRAAGTSVRMQFEGANPSLKVEGMERLPGHANFLIGAGAFRSMAPWCTGNCTRASTWFTAAMGGI
ncbi:MAG: hypothetical protein WBL65_14330 [Bryobacteraceae bacterium]